MNVHFDLGFRQMPIDSILKRLEGDEVRPRIIKGGMRFFVHVDALKSNLLQQAGDASPLFISAQRIGGIGISRRFAKLHYNDSVLRHSVVNSFEEFDVVIKAVDEKWSKDCIKNETIAFFSTKNL